MTGQSRRGSAIETVGSAAFGFVIAMLVQPLILGAFGMSIDLHTDFWLTVVFTCISLARSYVFRRAFNWLHIRGVV